MEAPLSRSYRGALSTLLTNLFNYSVNNNNNNNNDNNLVGGHSGGGGVPEEGLSKLDCLNQTLKLQQQQQQQQQ